MADSQADRLRHIGVIIAPDRLSVAIRFCDGGDPTLPTREQILEALAEHRVAAGPEVMDRVDEFLGLLSGDELPEEEFVVGEGRVVVEGKHEEFILDEAYVRRE